MATITQKGKIASYVEEFQQISVMVIDMVEDIIIHLFLKCLSEPLRGLAKAFKPKTLDEAISTALDLETSTHSSNPNWGQPSKFGQPSKLGQTSNLGTSRPSQTVGQPINKINQIQNKCFQSHKNPNQQRPKLDEATRRELQRKGLCFSCKKQWGPGQQCQGKGHHYLVEFYVPNEDEKEPEIENSDYESEYEDADFAELEQHGQPYPEIEEEDRVLASSTGESKFITIKVLGKLNDHSAVILIYGGATHNFIDDGFVAEKKLKTESFFGFLC